MKKEMAASFKKNKDSRKDKDPNLKFLHTLITLVLSAYIILGFGHVFGVSSTNILKNPGLTAYEFMPVMIVGLCYFYTLFTCGEFFGLLRYQFAGDTKETHPGLIGLRLISARSLSIFFVSLVCFYFLRIGFEETIIEKIILTGLPFLLGIYLIIILGRIYKAHMMPLWYFRQKRFLLTFCVTAQVFANLLLFFPLFFSSFIATIPTS